MRAGWEIVKLDEIISFERGLTYAKGDEVAFSSVGVLRSNNVDLTTQSLNLDEIKYLREDFEVPSKKKVKQSSLLMCMSNGSKDHLGKVALIDRELDYAFGGFMGLLTPDETKVFPKYLHYSLASKSFKDYIHSLADGANINNLKYKDLAAFDILLPPLPEQQRIVGILDKEFAKIDALKAKAEKSFQAAKDLFQATLKKELEPKEGWKKKRLDEICEITAELIDPTLPEYIDQIHIGGANIVAETGVLIDLKTSREENLISGKFPFDETMVLYSKIRPYLKKVCCPDIQGICSADIYPLKPNQDVDRTYLYYILLSQDFTDYAILGSARAGMPKVNRPYMFAYSCSIPEYEEQCKVANRLNTARKQTNALQENYQKTLSLCDDLKQALLRKAFNGEFS